MLTDEQYRDHTIDMLPDEGRKRYFTGHLARFLKQKEMFEKHLNFNPDSFVLDVGTWLPFVSWYLNHLFDCWVFFSGIETKDEVFAKKILSFPSNLIFSDYPKEAYDLIICTECLEHLPCNLYKIRDKLIEAVKSHGYLLISYPLKGANAQGYDQDLHQYDWNQPFGEHIREFTERNAEAFVSLPLVDKHIVHTMAYGGNIYQFLYKKE